MLIPLLTFPAHRRHRTYYLTSRLRRLPMSKARLTSAGALAFNTQSDRGCLVSPARAVMHDTARLLIRTRSILVHTAVQPPAARRPPSAFPQPRRIAPRTNPPPHTPYRLSTGSSVAQAEACNFPAPRTSGREAPTRVGGVSPPAYFSDEAGPPHDRLGLNHASMARSSAPHSCVARPPVCAANALRMASNTSIMQNRDLRHWRCGVRQRLRASSALRCVTTPRVRLRSGAFDGVHYCF
ncbi:hypothetical protein GY45DRAFT_1325562 [Cubamyces sp. BRFM 1775]|nr:hypothetical protein GY45DRAFT_1325562 [Cubamyces sp. BRFM 1775]